MRARSLKKTAGQSGKKRIAGPTSVKLGTLPEDELFCMFLLLDFETIFNMKQVSKDLKKRIEHILENMKFWERFPVLNITSDNARSIAVAGYGNLIAHSTQIFEKNLQEINTKIYSYYRKNEVLSFFKRKNVYQNEISTYDLATVQPLILRDHASTFLRKISRLGDLIPFIQEDNFDLNSILAVVIKFDDSVGSFKIGDMTFIGLLPNLIKYKAPRCFDLLLQAYFGSHACFEPIEQTPGFSLNDVRNLILYANDSKYTNRFIDLMIKLYPVNNQQNFLYQQIQFFCDNNRTDIVYESLRNIPEKRKTDILNQWKKLDIYSNLLWKLYAAEEYRYNLQESLEKALEFVKNNPHTSIDELIDHQRKMNTSFNSFIEIFHSNKESFLTI